MREMQHYNEIKYTCFEALKFTNNQICLAVFFIIIYLCWNISSSVFQRHLLLSVPKEILKSTVFHFQVLSQQCVHPHRFTFLQSKDRTGYPQGAGWAALNSSTQFAAKPFIPMPTAMQTSTTATHLKDHLTVPALCPCYFLDSVTDNKCF